MEKGKEEHEEDDRQHGRKKHGKLKKNKDAKAVGITWEDCYEKLI